MTKNTISYTSNHYTKKQSILFASSLLILFVYSIFIFGFDVIPIALMSYGTMFVVEYIFQKIRKKELGYSILYLPMIYTLLLPVTIPLWIVFVGAFFISFFGKGIFGGDTKYVIHPVVAGVLFITISFPAFLGANWLDPVTGEFVVSTPIVLFNSGRLDASFSTLLFGFTAGSIGETARLAIIVLGFALMLLNIIDIKIVISYLLSVLVLTVALNFLTSANLQNYYQAYLVGNVLFVSVFVATDPPTIPLYTKGRIYYGIGLGLITVLIRFFSAFPEGSLFAVVIMNAVAPLFDQGGANNEQVD